VLNAPRQPAPSLRYTAELYDALGDEVDVFSNRPVDLVEEQMELVEARSLHVPVRLLAHGLEVDAVREALVEQRDGFGACGQREVVLGVDEARLVESTRASGGWSRHGDCLGCGMKWFAWKPTASGPRDNSPIEGFRRTPFGWLMTRHRDVSLRQAD
jgi:hypothetical protein